MNQRIRIQISPALRGCRAFTLIELLVVTGVILILSGITFALAARINASAKTRSTENVIRGLDQILGEYELAKGPVPAMVSARAGEVLDQRVQRDGLPNFGTPDLTAAAAAETLTFPLVDGRYVDRVFPIANIDPASDPSGVQGLAQKLDRDLDPPQPACALFLIEAGRYTGAGTLLKNLGSTFVQRTACSAWGWAQSAIVVSQFDLYPQNDSAGLRPLYITTVNDAWGRPIRFSHPAFQGGAGAYFDATTTSFPPTRPQITLRGPVSGQDPMRFDRSYRAYDAMGFSATGQPLSGEHLVGDCDEGRHPAGRPYFYSAGPDGNPGARTQNVYVDGGRPEFPAETARYSAD